MFTQCPKCETVFRITMEQLQAHNGVVRCGQCDHVFSADQRLFEEIPSAARPAAGTRKQRPSGNNKSKSTKPKPRAPEAPATSTRKPPYRPKKAPSAPESEEVEAAPAPWVAPQTGAPERTEKQRTAAPTFIGAEEAPLRRRESQVRHSVLWIVGGLSLLVTLVAQSVYFYRDQLAAWPELRPYLQAICLEIGCTLRPPYDATRIELVQPTNIAPHPRFANALRLRATLVNRAAKPQPQPLMQVTLTDSSGHILSRRTFAPAQYLEQRSAVGSDMAPHLAVGALLDLTNGDGKAVGYQIEFFPPPIQ